jgi:hypothetical protein
VISMISASLVLAISLGQNMRSTDNLRSGGGGAQAAIGGG